jgi:aconitate hydratase
MNLTEKLLARHALDGDVAGPYLRLQVDRVALQDVSGQMVLLQLLASAVERVAVPTALHCDHLITAAVGAARDVAHALDANAEIYDFLRDASDRYGITFWPPGSGIIHQVTLERYATPGDLLIGTDSHTPNAGGLGVLAIGVGGPDAVDVLAGRPLTLPRPTVVGVHLTGALDGWTSAKDVILRVAEVLGVSGGTGAVIEYFGPGASTIAATGKATICNMGAEVGATTSVFPFDERMAAYLSATGRAEVARRARDADLRADEDATYDRVVEIDLSSLEPRLNGPDSPGRSHVVGRVHTDAPRSISSALIGSCTNSSYEDLSRSASVARAAAARGLRVQCELLVTPGSEQVRATIERDGILADLESIGATVLANACGPCIGQWTRSLDEPNTIVTSFNRNFPKRNDGRTTTKAFVTSPETVVALALAGTIDFDPRVDPLAGELLPPPEGDALPRHGFAAGVGRGPIAPTGSAEVRFDPASDRLQRLEPFPAWDGGDLVQCPVLVKAAEPCTTDAISAAGPWLRYRGHLEHISRNLFLGVTNAWTGAVGEGRDWTDGQTRPLPDIAFRLRDEGVRWCVVGGANYGEGSSREFAAMEPRLLGCVAVVARSFARIHETNLKKHGLLPLTFEDPAVYDAVEEGSHLSVLGLDALAPGRPVECVLHRPDGTTMAFSCRHTFDEEQLGWFRAGSSINALGRRP